MPGKQSVSNETLRQLGAFLRYFIVHTLLKGSGGTPSVWGQGISPVAENGFRAFQMAKMSYQDTQLNTFSCIILQKSS